MDLALGPLPCSAAMGAFDLVDLRLDSTTTAAPCPWAALAVARPMPGRVRREFSDALSIQAHDHLLALRARPPPDGRG